MSFILDALRKAERDRNLGQAPGLQDVAMASDEARRKNEAPQPTPRLLVLAGLILLVCLGLYLIFKPQHESAKPAHPLPPGKITATVRGPAPPPATASAEPQEPTQPPDEDLTPAIDESASLASFDDLTGSNPPPAIAPEPATPAPEPTSRPDFVVHPEPPRRANVAPEAPMPSAAETVMPEAPSRLSSFDPPPAPATAAPANASALESMPQAYQAAFPTFSVDVHVWDSNPQKRFVLVSGRRYREGDTLAAGPKLVEIAQQGLIVDYNGERVLYSIAQ